MSHAQLHLEADPATLGRPGARQSGGHDLPSTGAAVAPRRAATPPNLLHLQRLAGNRAVTGLLDRRPSTAPIVTAPWVVPQLAPVQAPTIQRCGRTPASQCDCHPPTLGPAQRQDDQAAAPVQRKDYANTHTCGVSESARIFSSWAVAVAKLTENIPFLAASWASGVATPNLKSNLLRHFKVAKNDKAERKRVLGRLVSGYTTILGRMGPGLAKVRCGGTHCKHNWYAYTFGGTNNSTIWLCGVEFSNKPTLDLASTWIHELSHAFFSTVDNGYYTYTGAATVADTNACLTEADCWGNFMVSYT